MSLKIRTDEIVPRCFFPFFQRIFSHESKFKAKLQFLPLTGFTRIMIEEANKKLLGMKDLKKVVMGGRSRSERSANDPGAASAQATESGQPLQMNCR